MGRSTELGDVVALMLRPVRLITLLGPGGIGKTRLAAEVARRYHSSTGVQVRWAGLARLEAGADRAAVVAEIAQAAVELDFSERSSWDALVGTLTGASSGRRDPEAVLVLDNCEHVAATVADVVLHLHAAVPRLTVLATSRMPIGWVEEHRVIVAPLADRDASALFRMRAQLTGRTLADSEHDTDITTLCRRLDNHPLYVRLAAARLAHRSLSTLLSEVSGGPVDDRRLEWSDGARFGGEVRHRAVTDVIAWSYELCSESERLLFDRMSVFAAGYDAAAADGSDPVLPDTGICLDAIEFVCADADDADPAESGRLRLVRAEIEPALHALVDQSLVTLHLTPTAVRYSLVECLRMFARQRMAERPHGEEERLAWRYVRFYQHKLAYAAANWCEVGGRELLLDAVQAWPNIQTAVELTTTLPGAAEIGLEICVHLFESRIVFVKGSFRELQAMSERTLAASRAQGVDAAPLQLRTVAASALAALCQGDFDTVNRMLDICAAEARKQDWRACGDDIGMSAEAEFTWAHQLWAAGDPRAITVALRAAAKFTRRGRKGGALHSELTAAAAAAQLGTAQQAAEFAARFRILADSSGSDWARAWATLVQAMGLTRSGKAAEAMAATRGTLTGLIAARERFAGLCAVHIYLGAAGRLLGDLVSSDPVDQSRIPALAVQTAQLLGGAQRLRVWVGIDVYRLGIFRTEVDMAHAAARKFLGADQYRLARAAGEELRPELDEVYRLALGTLQPHRAASVASASWQQLTRAEKDVALLAASGWTNTAIAARRGSSRKTVDAQMAAVLHKLGIGTRDDIVDRVPAELAQQVRMETDRVPRRKR
ncbi:MAG: LuxR family transcriptional regulator [Mycobacteriaceae bacterium]|nr:LuxR family transcriptional regulator [Mycobacteriaceae bacterium]